jgi:uncharacterized membrane protein
VRSPVTLRQPSTVEPGVEPTSRIPLRVTVGLIAVFGLVHAWLAVGRHNAFGTWGFDLGIYDQAVWIVSRGETFLSIRGLNVWGHHVNAIAFLYAPFVWLGAGARFLIATQAFVLALGAYPAHRIGARRLGSEWAGTICALMVVSTPALGWLAWNNFHFEALSITALLFAWWWATERRWRRCGGALLIGLSTREEVGLVVAVLGVALVVHVWRGGRSQRVRAAAVALGGGLWYLVCTKAVMPWALGGSDPYYFTRFYGEWGGSAGDLARNIVTKPGKVARTATADDRMTLWTQLLAPTGGLALLGLPVLLAAAPQALAVALGSQWFLRDLRFQYTALMLAPLFLATIEGAARIVRRFPGARVVVLGWMVFSSLVGHLWLAPSPLGSGSDSWGGVNDVAAHRAAVNRIGATDGVSAIEAIVPHVAQRRDVYSYPSPFLPVMYGVRSNDLAPLADINKVRWIVTQDGATDSPGRRIDAELFDALTSRLRAYEIVSRSDSGLVVARQIRPLSAMEIMALRTEFAARSSS